MFRQPQETLPCPSVPFMVTEQCLGQREDCVPLQGGAPLPREASRGDWGPSGSSLGETRFWPHPVPSSSCHCRRERAGARGTLALTAREPRHPDTSCCRREEPSLGPALPLRAPLLPAESTGGGGGGRPTAREGIRPGRRDPESSPKFHGQLAHWGTRCSDHLAQMERAGEGQRGCQGWDRGWTSRCPQPTPV